MSKVKSTMKTQLEKQLDHSAAQTVEDLLASFDNNKRRPWFLIVRERMAELIQKIQVK